MRSFLLTGLSLALTATVIGNAYYQKKQFYPSVVYITKSNPSMAVLYIQALVFVVLTGKMLRALFFGQLRDAEMEHLIERSWYAVTETCLAFTVFRDDFSPRFVALFTLLLFLKCFHWLAEDRIDYMERSPAISWLFHLRALSLMFVLGFLDIMFVRHAFYSTLLKGPSVQLVFGFEYEILFTVVLMIFIKYVLHAIDLQSQNPWDNKAVYLLYSELIMGLIRVVLYIAFVFIMIKVHTFPLFAIRPMYLTVRAFQKAAQDVILSRRAIRNMNTLYPDATPEELSSGDNVCIICREEMTTNCKKLPCNHIFHTSCLRSWFQRQQTCPTCRLEVLRMPRPAAAQQAQQQQQQQQAQPAQPPADNQNPFNNMPGMFGGFPFQWPPNAGGQAVPPPFGWPQQQQQQQQQQQPGAAGGAAPTSQAQTQAQAGTASSSSTSTSSTSTTTSSSSTATPGVPPFASMAPPFPGSMPFMPPMMPPMFSPFSFPPPPVPMSGLSEEELRAMEGVERGNVEARVQWLRDIQALLDGAMLLIGQYNTVASQMGTAPTAPPPQASSSQASSSSSPSSSLPSSSSLSSSSATLSQTAQLQDNAQGRAWPQGEGARPKYTSTISNTHTTDSPERARSSSISQDAEKQVEGAVGGAPAKEEDIPKWENPREEGHEDEMHEVRKRRLQHFSQQNSSPGDESSSSSGKHEQH
ncbi:E3 ubiquitin-protein ligase synoviolin B isoform X2 [Aplysia californica]|uniref:RING-type E3 ubiquitin transferase n=1 Tax=Aplysia californica TaxID=6500 RepID=A0ABM1VRZ4_APLCA|nr:E3 ubiquitin-protein ligase synoviolin B isoform X2 [Aplysia californica]